MTALKAMIQVWKNPGRVIKTPVLTGINNDWNFNPKISQADNELNDDKI